MMFVASVRVSSVTRPVLAHLAEDGVTPRGQSTRCLPAPAGSHYRIVVAQARRYLERMLARERECCWGMWTGQLRFDRALLSSTAVPCGGRHRGCRGTDEIYFIFPWSTRRRRPLPPHPLLTTTLTRTREHPPPPFALSFDHVMCSGDVVIGRLISVVEMRPWWSLRGLGAPALLWFDRH